MGLMDLHSQSSHHRELLLKEEIGSCFYCCWSFYLWRYPGIQEWTDDGETALCPRCGNCIDAVLPGWHPKSVLRQMREIWFEHHAELKG